MATDKIRWCLVTNTKDTTNGRVLTTIHNSTPSITQSRAITPCSPTTACKWTTQATTTATKHNFADTSRTQEIAPSESSVLSHTRRKNSVRWTIPCQTKLWKTHQLLTATTKLYYAKTSRLEALVNMRTIALSLMVITSSGVLMIRWNITRQGTISKTGIILKDNCQMASKAKKF